MENLLYLYVHLSLNSLLFFPFGVYFFAGGRRLGAKPVFLFYFPSLSRFVFRKLATAISNTLSLQ
jgi:hypothetical protein